LSHLLRHEIPAAFRLSLALAALDCPPALRLHDGTGCADFEVIEEEKEQLARRRNRRSSGRRSRQSQPSPSFCPAASRTRARSQ
jgi:hypothetical protein